MFHITVSCSSDVATEMNHDGTSTTAPLTYLPCTDPVVCVRVKCQILKSFYIRWWFQWHMANMVAMQANFGLDVHLTQVPAPDLQKLWVDRWFSLFLTDQFPEARHSCGDIIMTSACWNSDGGRHLWITLVILIRQCAVTKNFPPFLFLSQNMSLAQ